MADWWNVQKQWNVQYYLLWKINSTIKQWNIQWKCTLQQVNVQWNNEMIIETMKWSLKQYNDHWNNEVYIKTIKETCNNLNIHKLYNATIQLKISYVEYKKVKVGIVFLNYCF